MEGFNDFLGEQKPGTAVISIPMAYLATLMALKDLTVRIDLSAENGTSFIRFL